MAEKNLEQNSQQAAERLAENTSNLSKYGGFDLISTTVDGSQNLDPKKKALKSIFLSEDTYSNDRKELKKRLELFIGLLNEHDNVADMVSASAEKAAAVSTVLNKNLKKALDSTRELETSYRTVALFYKNTGSPKLKNVSIVNAEIDQISDLDNTVFFDHIADEMNKNFNRLDLADNYSMIVLPGYLGNNAVLNKWGQMAWANKAMMITDFRDLEAPDDVMALFESAKHAGSDVYRANMLMCCNYVVGREKEEDLGEEDHLYVPPSAALAGQLYKAKISQPSAGYKYGGLDEISGTRFELRQTEISDLEKLGLIPMVSEFGKVMAFSSKTLFNGDNIGLQTYSVVRVFDWFAKSLCDYLNRMTFQNFNVKTKRAIEKQIIKFLEANKGSDKLIEKFKIMRFEQDKNQKDRIHLDIHLKPFFPAKNFVIKLDGTQGDDPDSTDWESEYDEA
jgi:hypothetical protein